MHTEEVKEKIRRSNFGKKLSDETRAKLREAAILRYKTFVTSAETRKKLSEKAKLRVCSENTRAKLAESTRLRNTGKRLSDITKKKISESNKGKKDSEATREKKSKSQIGRLSGPKHHCWKGGITKEAELIRTSAKYKKWKRSVKERDDFKCVRCGEAPVEAHHINPFATHPELRFDISNGESLCKKCHVKTPTYGKRIS